MNKITRIKTGNRMSQIVIHNDTIYLARQVGNTEDGVAEQTKTCLEKVEALLNEAGSDKTRILQTNIWLDKMAGQSDAGKGTGKTTAQMKTLATFTDTATTGLSTSWDFDTI